MFCYVRCPKAGSGLLAPQPTEQTPGTGAAAPRRLAGLAKHCQSGAIQEFSSEIASISTHRSIGNPGR